MDKSIAASNYSYNLIANHFYKLMWFLEQIMRKSFDKRLAGFLLEDTKSEITGK